MLINVDAKTVAINQFLSHYDLPPEEVFDKIILDYNYLDEVIVWEPFDDYPNEFIMAQIHNCAIVIQTLLNEYSVRE